jgi:signal transduction histidine kinase
MLRSGPTPADSASLIHDVGNFIQVASSALNILARNPRLRDSDIEPILASARASLSAAGSLVLRNAASLRSDDEIDNVDVAQCLAEVEALVVTSWDRRFRLHKRLEEGLPRLRCNRVALQNAILNLLLNARDAMPNGGDVALGAVAREREVEIAVADNGVGMSAETIERAFEPFFTTKADGLGGLGLPSVERFARMAGGRVRVASELGVGTIVALFVPAETSRGNDGSGPSAVRNT